MSLLNIYKMNKTKKNTFSNFKRKLIDMCDLYKS